MRRRELLKYAGATAIAAPFIGAARADNNAVKVGIVGAKTGPLAPATASTFFPAGDCGRTKSTKLAVSS